MLNSAGFWNLEVVILVVLLRNYFVIMADLPQQGSGTATQCNLMAVLLNKTILAHHSVLE